MADKKLICLQYRLSVLVKGRDAKWPVVYSFNCPACATKLRVSGGLAHIHRMDAEGNWQFIETLRG